ncbi:MAG: flagellar biosynthesis protein FliP [Myxococcales bacterium]|nr:flagellar biosynthesis protein FliP [Myxococcales bacterium]
MILLLASIALAVDAQVGVSVAEPGALLAGQLVDGVGQTPSSTAVRLLLMLTGMSFIPAMLVVMTPFVRFVVVFSMLRQALGLQQSPPNQVIVGLSLFLAMLVMQPTLTASWEGGVAPYLDGQTEASIAMHDSLAPLRGFMFANTRREDMATILQVGELPRPESLDDVPTPAVVSAFVLSELKTAFITTIYVFVPFLVIDLVVASVLVGMGMMMLPPVVVSLPFKLIIFVLMDGWALLVRDLAAGVVR